MVDGRVLETLEEKYKAFFDGVVNPRLEGGDLETAWGVTVLVRTLPWRIEVLKAEAYWGYYLAKAMALG